MCERILLHNEYSKLLGIKLYQHSFKKYSPPSLHIDRFRSISLSYPISLATTEVSICTEEIIHPKYIIDAWKFRHMYDNRLENIIGKLAEYGESDYQTKDKIVDSFAEEMAEEIVDFVTKRLN
jgi:hypothetical protein